jgi:hypothetical protein
LLCTHADHDDLYYLFFRICATLRDPLPVIRYMTGNDMDYDDDVPNFGLRRQDTDAVYWDAGESETHYDWIGRRFGGEWLPTSLNANTPIAKLIRDLQAGTKADIVLQNPDRFAERKRQLDNAFSTRVAQTTGGNEETDEAGGQDSQTTRRITRSLASRSRTPR